MNEYAYMAKVKRKLDKNKILLERRHEALGYSHQKWDDALYIWASSNIIIVVNFLLLEIDFVYIWFLIYILEENPLHST